MNKADWQQKIVGRMFIKGTLRLLSPLLIGQGEQFNGQTNDKDIHVLKNEQGVPYIPGTSLAGVLRAPMK